MIHHGICCSRLSVLCATGSDKATQHTTCILGFSLWVEGAFSGLTCFMDSAISSLFSRVISLKWASAAAHSKAVQQWAVNLWARVEGGVSCQHANPLSSCGLGLDAHSACRCVYFVQRLQCGPSFCTLFSHPAQQTHPVCDSVAGNETAVECVLQ